MSGISHRKECAWVAHYLHPNWDVARTGSKIRQRVAFTAFVPLVDIANPDFQLQRRRHAVPGLNLVVLRVLAVGVQVDEPCRHYLACRINGVPSLQCFLRNCADLAIGNSDIPHGIHARFWIDHSSAGQN